MKFSHHLKKYCEHFPGEIERLAPLLKQMENDCDITHRKTLPGHVTASALVIDEENILLIFHPFLKKWIQPGGHLDIGEMPLEAAQRELMEETGISVSLHRWHKAEAIPFDIDIHLIPANPEKGETEHLHYDFRFLFSVDKSESIKNHEDHASRWVKFHEAEELQVLVEKIKKQQMF